MLSSSRDELLIELLKRLKTRFIQLNAYPLLKAAHYLLGGTDRDSLIHLLDDAVPEVVLLSSLFRQLVLLELPLQLSYNVSLRVPLILGYQLLLKLEADEAYIQRRLILGGVVLGNGCLGHSLLALHELHLSFWANTWVVALYLVLYVRDWSIKASQRA